jgi:hypothetical protein
MFLPPRHGVLISQIGINHAQSWSIYARHSMIALVYIQARGGNFDVDPRLENKLKKKKGMYT